MTETAELINAKVTAGEAALDTARPGWYRAVDIETLDINDMRTCVLGQVYGWYWDGVDALFNGSAGTAREHGFDWDGYTPVAELTDEWYRRIKARQAADDAELDREHDDEYDADWI